MNEVNGTLPRTAPEAARYHLARGEFPVPIPARTKKCIEPEWPALRITEPEIDTLFAPGGNIGLLLGEPSGGLIDVDLDTSEAVAAAEHLLPATERISGRRSAPRSHYWYTTGSPPQKAAEEYLDPVADKAARVCLVELRSTGGMTVIPPSVYAAEPDKGHPSPEHCIWTRYGTPTRIDIDELRQAVGAVAAAALLARYWPQGARHHGALALAGGLLRAGWEIEKVERFIQALCVAAGDREVKDRLTAVRDTAGMIEEGKSATGWPKLEKFLGRHGGVIVPCVREWLGLPCLRSDTHRLSPSASQKTTPPIRPVPLPPYVPFPTHLLPPPVRSYVEATAAAMNCDPSYSALPALAALGAAIGSSHVASPKRGWKEPPYIWALPIGRSGAIKSPPYRDVEDMAEDINDQLEQKHESEVAEYEVRLQEWTEAKKNGEDPGPKPTAPVPKAFIKGDVTIEALVGDLQDNPRGLLIGQDELSAWITGFVKYSGKLGASDLSRWLQLHGAGSINYTRKTGDRRKVRIRGVGVSVAGTIQPKILSRVLNEEFRASGFLARLLLAMPPWRQRRWSEEEVDESVRGDFVELLSCLRELPRGSWPDGRPCPHLVKLAEGAKEMFIAFYDANGEALATADEDMGAAMSKLEGYSLRFALIFHCCRLKEYAKDARITPEDMEAAIKLTMWFRDEAERVYMALGETPEQQAIRQLSELVARLAEKRGGQITVREFQRSKYKKYPTTEVAEAALVSLVEQGFGEWKEIPCPTRGGHARRAYAPRLTLATATPEADEEEGDDGVEVDTRQDQKPEKPAGSSHTGDVIDNVVEDCDYVADEPVVIKHGGSSVNPAGERVEGATGASVNLLGDSVECQPHPHRNEPMVVTDPSGLERVVGVLRGCSHPVGLDLETTGLSSIRDRVRLLSIATPAGTFLIDLFQVDPAPLWPALAATIITGHNLGFDLPFLMRLGFVPGRVRDTMLASQVLNSSDFSMGHSLKEAAHRHLSVTLNKELQTADWSGPLSPAHLDYAARDAELPVTLWEKLAPDLGNAGLTAVVDAEMAALPTIAWTAVKGIGFDRAAWEAVAAENEAAAQSWRDQLDAAAPNPGNLLGVTNWNSIDDVKTAFGALGLNLESTDDDALSAISHPVAELLREYRAATKLAGTYGREWLRHVAQDGRVYATWKQLGAGASGRMSCKEPNLQQLPRDPRFRRCFVGPPGRVLVKADYSQIELRIAAKLTGDKRMLDAYRKGEDLHTLTARALLGKEEVAKADRQLAKAVNFGLLYGQGAKGLARYARSNYGVALTETEAAKHRETFFRTYPGLRAWHRSMTDGPIETRTLAGRRRTGVVSFPEKLNTPVQGTGADGLKRALGLLWERRSACPDAFPVLLVHDEIVVECDEARQEEAAVWLRDAMQDGMAPLVTPVPVEVEVSAGRTWGG